MFLILPIYGVIVISSNLLYESIGSILIAMFVIFALIMMTSLITLFIYKLIKVYKLVENENKSVRNERMIGAITKLAVLSSISISISIINMISYIIAYGNFIKDVHFHGMQWYLHWFLQLGDIYTNFLCAVLCLKMYSKRYVKICKCLDAKCRKCWINILQNKEHAATLKPVHIQLESNTLSIPTKKSEDLAVLVE